MADDSFLISDDGEIISPEEYTPKTPEQHHYRGKPNPLQEAYETGC